MSQNIIYIKSTFQGVYIKKYLKGWINRLYQSNIKKKSYTQVHPERFVNTPPIINEDHLCIKRPHHLNSSTISYFITSILLNNRRKIFFRFLSLFMKLNNRRAYEWANKNTVANHSINNGRQYIYFWDYFHLRKYIIIYLWKD